MFDEGYRVENTNGIDSGSLKERFHFYIKQTRIQILVLFFVTILVYANSLQVPFYLDDFHSIVENPIIHDISTMFEKRDFQIMRLTGTYSLAANYAIHQTSVFGYHILNIIIHFLTGIAVFFFVRGIVVAYLSKNDNKQLSKNYILYLPLISALIFLLHPLQTQAITYIVQRHASLAALFYIASLATYVFARLQQTSIKQALLYLLTAIFTVLALLSKENTVTLIGSLLLVEILFFQHFSAKRAVLWFISCLVLSALVALCLHYFIGISFELIDRYTHTADVKHISRLEYFSTQTLVLWHYIKLFFFPVGLHLDYDISLQKDFFSSSVIIALIAHLIVLASTAYIAKQKPILIFAVFFYYIAHSVESGIIPILDLAFEHRTYLPNLGLSILVASLLLYLLDTKQKIAFPIIIMLLIVLAILTIQRNNQWANPVQFYHNETRMSPNKERVWAELGKIYIKEKQFTEALQALGQALNIGREGNTINALPTTFLNTYLALLYSGQSKKAIYFESKIPVNKLSRYDRSVFYFMQANRFLQGREYAKAISGYEAASKLNPLNYDAKANLAALYIETGKIQQGKLLLNEVLIKQPHHKLALIYQKKYLSK